MKLWVVKYSPPPPRPPNRRQQPVRAADTNEGDDDLMYRLPIIHIAGTSRGSDVDDHAARRIEGTVRMIGDNAVRWSLVRLTTDSVGVCLLIGLLLFV